MWHVQVILNDMCSCFRLYDDLNDFLETRERVISITRIMSMVRTSNYAVLMAVVNYVYARSRVIVGLFNFCRENESVLMSQMMRSQS